MRSPDARLGHIDTLRAGAALLVLWMHVSESFYNLSAVTEASSRWLYDIARDFDVGRVGVVTFFAISGFVIPGSIRSDRPAALGNFVIRRLCRIYPAYWASLALGVMTGYWLWGNSFPLRDFLIDLSLLQDVFGAQAPQGLYWTLVVEMVFYACCVMLLLTRSIHNLRRIASLVVVLSAMYVALAGWSWLGLSRTTFPLGLWCAHLGIMFWGTLSRAHVDGRAGDPWVRTVLWGVPAAFCIVIPLFAIHERGLPGNYTVSYALGLAIFIAGAGWLRFSSPLTAWLGRISYSIYLFHPPVFLTLRWWLLQLPADSWWRTQHLGVYLLITALLTAALATAVFRFVEEPGMALGKRLGAAWSARSLRRCELAADPLLETKSL